MKVLVIWLMAMGFALGLETAGWRVPLEKLVEDGLKDPKVKKLDSAPAESAFFEAGDELWDLSGAVEMELWGIPRYSSDEDPFSVQDEEVIERRPFSGEWLVWNVRSETVVGRGTLAEMAMLDAQLELKAEPFQIRTSLEVGAEGKEKKVSLVTTSGETSKVKTDAVDLEVATNLSAEWMDLNVGATMSAGESVKEVVLTGLTMKLDREMKVAAWRDASRDWEMKVIGEAVTFDGVPVGSIRLVEKEGELVSVGMKQAYEDDRLDGMKLDGGLLIRLYPVPPDFVARITDRGVKDGAWDLPDLEVSEELGELLASRYIDISSAMKDNGMKFEHESAVAGFDPRRSMILVVNDAENVDLAEAITATIGSGPLHSVELNFDWEEGSCMLVLRSGEKASIRREKGEHVVSMLEAAPNVSGNGKIVDLMFYLQTMDGDLLNTAVALRAGTAVEVGTFWKKGKERKVMATAKVLEVGDEY